MLKMKNTIAIQGAEGSNHHKVAKDFYGETINLKECMSFDVLVAALLNRKATQGIMALENTIAGSIIPNYALIDSNDLHICGEKYLNIHHHLMAFKGQKIEDIKEVCSHPMALLQCKEFFKKHPHIKLVEDVDTAEVAVISNCVSEAILSTIFVTVALASVVQVISSPIFNSEVNRVPNP